MVDFITAMKGLYDVAVVGSGPSGSATARWLALRGHNVVLIERSDFGSVRAGESLSPDVQPLLRDLGVWERFTALNPVPSHGTRSVWGGSGELHSHSHLMSPWGCGWHVDRAIFDQMLAEEARSAGAVFFARTRVTGLRYNGMVWSLSLKSDEYEGRADSNWSVDAKVVVDATGRPATVSRALGAACDQSDQLVGISLQFTTIQDAGGFVLVESDPNGWWYSAPLPGCRVAVMFMTDGDICRRRQLRDESRWWQLLASAQETTQRLSGAVRACGPQIFSAASRRLRRPGSTGSWLAVGDAALAVDPISGSGVVRALRSARIAVETMTAILNGGNACRLINEYESALDAEWMRYLKERTAYYSLEHRWMDSEFWQRRVAG